jgi:distribution and morphology protein 10
MYSTDSALLGFRGLYNFGLDPRVEVTAPTTAQEVIEKVHGRFSAGAELYYGILNKSGGISTGLRFTTLPNHAGFPYTMTLTLNPLMGNLSSTYSVKAGPNLALCSRFDFNFYSYESELQLGCELWRRRRNTDPEAVKKLLSDSKPPTGTPDDDVSGILKARVDQKWRIGVLWEGRIKELLFTLGASLDLKKREQIFRAVGIELQYSS